MITDKCWHHLFASIHLFYIYRVCFFPFVDSIISAFRECDNKWRYLWMCLKRIHRKCYVTILAARQRHFEQTISITWNYEDQASMRYTVYLWNLTHRKWALSIYCWCVSLVLFIDAKLNRFACGCFLSLYFSSSVCLSVSRSLPPLQPLFFHATLYRLLAIFILDYLFAEQCEQVKC